MTSDSKRLEWRSATRTREISVSCSRGSGMGARSVGDAWASQSMRVGSITEPWTTVICGNVVCMLFRSRSSGNSQKGPAGNTQKGTVPVKRHRGEPGHTRDTRAHTDHTDEPHNHPNPSTHGRRSRPTHRGLPWPAQGTRVEGWPLATGTALATAVAAAALTAAALAAAALG